MFKAFSSSILSKVLVACSGLALVLFLIAHLVGNLLIFSGPEALNKYAQGLRDLGPLLWIMRIGLLVALVAHVAITIRLKNLSNTARPVDYEREQAIASTIYSRTMLLSGLAVFSFVLFHLAHYTWGIVQPDEFKVSYVLMDGRAVHDVYKMMIAGFKVPLISIFYGIAVTAVFAHLQHALQSAFQTLGFNHPQYRSMIEGGSWILSVLLWLGFMSIPVAIAMEWVH